MNSIRLKKACKARGLSTAGSIDELRSRLGLPAAPEDVDAMKYIQLRKTLKNLQVDSAGKPDELRKRLKERLLQKDEAALEQQAQNANGSVSDVDHDEEEKNDEADDDADDDDNEIPDMSSLTAAYDVDVDVSDSSGLQDQADDGNDEVGIGVRDEFGLNSATQRGNADDVLAVQNDSEDNDDDDAGTLVSPISPISGDNNVTFVTSPRSEHGSPGNSSSSAPGGPGLGVRFHDDDEENIHDSPSDGVVSDDDSNDVHPKLDEEVPMIPPPVKTTISTADEEKANNEPEDDEKHTAEELAAALALLPPELRDMDTGGESEVEEAFKPGTVSSSDTENAAIPAKILNAGAAQSPNLTLDSSEDASFDVPSAQRGTRSEASAALDSINTDVKASDLLPLDESGVLEDESAVTRWMSSTTSVPQADDMLGHSSSDEDIGRISNQSGQSDTTSRHLRGPSADTRNTVDLPRRPSAPRSIRGGKKSETRVEQLKNNSSRSQESQSPIRAYLPSSDDDSGSEPYAQVPRWQSNLDAGGRETNALVADDLCPSPLKRAREKFDATRSGKSRNARTNIVSNSSSMQSTGDRRHQTPMRLLRAGRSRFASPLLSRPVAASFRRSVVPKQNWSAHLIDSVQAGRRRRPLRADFSLGASASRTSYSASPAYRSPARDIGHVRQSSAMAKMRMRMKSFQQSLEAKVAHLNDSTRSDDFLSTTSASHLSRSPLSLSDDSDDIDVMSGHSSRNGRRRVSGERNSTSLLLSDDLEEKFDEVDRVHSRILASLGHSAEVGAVHTAASRLPSTPGKPRHLGTLFSTSPGQSTIGASHRFHAVQSQQEAEFQHKAALHRKKQMELQQSIQAMVQANASAPLQLDVPDPVLPAVMIPSAENGRRMGYGLSDALQHKSPIHLGASLMVREIEDLKDQQQALLETLKEVKQQQEDQRQQQLSRHSSPMQTKDSFTVIDLNNDGVISEQEFQHAAGKSNSPPDVEHQRDLFAALDANGDGVVSKEEFEQAAVAPDDDLRSTALMALERGENHSEKSIVESNQGSSSSPATAGTEASVATSSDASSKTNTDIVVHAAAAAAAASTSMLAESFGHVAKQLSALAAQQESQNQLMASFIQQQALNRQTSPQHLPNPNQLSPKDTSRSPLDFAHEAMNDKLHTPRAQGVSFKPDSTHSQPRRSASQRSLALDLDPAAASDIANLLSTISPTRAMIGHRTAKKKRGRRRSESAGLLLDGDSLDEKLDDETEEDDTEDDPLLSLAAQEQMSLENQIKVRQAAVVAFLVRSGVKSIAKDVPGGEKAVGAVAILPHAWMRTLRTFELFFDTLRAGKIDHAQLVTGLVAETASIETGDVESDDEERQAMLAAVQEIVDDIENAASKHKLRFKAFLLIDSMTGNSAELTEDRDAETAFAVDITSERGVLNSLGGGEKWVGIRLRYAEVPQCSLFDLEVLPLGALATHPLRKGALLDKKLGSDPKFRVKPRKIWLSDNLDTLHWSKDLGDAAEAKTSKELRLAEVVQLDIQPQSTRRDGDNTATDDTPAHMGSSLDVLNTTGGTAATTYHLCYELKNNDGNKKKEVHLRVAQSDPERKLSEVDYSAAAEWLVLLQELVPARLCKRAMLAVCDYNPPAGQQRINRPEQLRFSKGQTLFEVVRHHGLLYGFTVEQMLSAAADAGRRFRHRHRRQRVDGSGSSALGAVGRASMPLLRSFRPLHVHSHPLCEGCMIYKKKKKLSFDKKSINARFVWCSDDLQLLFWAKSRPAEGRDRSTDRSLHKYVPLRTLARVVVDADKRLREEDDGKGVFRRLDANLTVTLLQHTIKQGHSDDSTPSPSLWLVVSRLSLKHGGTGGSGDGGTESDDESLAARQWLVHFWDFVSVMHPQQKWIFPQIHRPLTALTVSQPWHGRGWLVDEGSTDNGNSEQPPKNDLHGGDVLEKDVHVPEGDLMLAVRAGDQWHGTVYPKENASAESQTTRPPVIVSMPARGSDRGVWLQRHMAYTGYGVQTKRTDETAFKPSRHLWVSQNLSFVLWAKGSTRFESIFDEDDFGGSAGGSDDDFAMQSAGGSGHGQMRRSMSTSSIRGGGSAPITPIKRRKSFKKVPNCIALADVISVEDTASMAGAGARDAGQAILSLTISFWLRGHSLGALPTNSPLKNSAQSGGGSASAALDILMPSEDAKKSLLLLLTSLVEHGRAAAAAAMLQLQRMHNQDKTALDLVSKSSRSGNEISKLAVDTTSSRPPQPPVQSAQKQDNVEDGLPLTATTDAASRRAAEGVRDRIAAVREDRDTADDTADFDTSAEFSPTAPRGNPPNEEQAPWVGVPPLLVRRKAAHESRFGKVEWMRFEPGGGLVLEWWRCDSEPALLETGISGTIVAEEQSSFPWPLTNFENEQTAGENNTGATLEAQAMPTGLRLDLKDLESVSKYGEHESDDDEDDDDEAEEPAEHGISLTLRNFKGRIDVDLRTGDVELWIARLKCAAAAACMEDWKSLAASFWTKKRQSVGARRLGGRMGQLQKVLTSLRAGAVVQYKKSTENSYKRPRYFWVTQSSRFLCWTKGDSLPDGVGGGGDAAVIALAAQGKSEYIAITSICDVHIGLAARLPKDVPETGEVRDQLNKTSLTISFQDDAVLPGDTSNDTAPNVKPSSFDIVFGSKRARDTWAQGFRLLGRMQGGQADKNSNVGEGESEFGMLQKKLKEGLVASVKCGSQTKYREACIVWMSPDQKYLCWSKTKANKPPVDDVSVHYITQNPVPKLFDYVRTADILDLKTGLPPTLDQASKDDLTLLKDLCLRVVHKPSAAASAGGGGHANETAVDLVLETVVAHRLLFTVLARQARLSFEDGTPESVYAPDAWTKARQLRRRGQLVGSMGSAVNLLRRNFALLLEGALCSKKFATETKLQRRFVWLSPSKKFLCYCKTTTKPPNCDTDPQILALAKSKKLKFIPVSEINGVEQGQLPQKLPQEMKEDGETLKDYCITIAAQAADKKRVKAGKGEVIELIVPTTKICKAWVAGLITLAGLVPSEPGPDNETRLAERRAAEQAQMQLAKIEEEEAVVVSPTTALGVQHRSSLGWTKTAAALAAVEVQRQLEAEMGKEAARQLVAAHKGSCVALKMGTEAAYKEPRVVWLSEDQHYLCWTNAAAREKPKLETGPVNVFSVSVLTPKPKSFSFLAVDDVVALRGGPATKMTPALKQQLEAGSTMADLCFSVEYIPGKKKGKSSGAKPLSLDLRTTSCDDRSVWLGVLQKLSGVVADGIDEGVVVEENSNNDRNETLQAHGTGESTAGLGGSNQSHTQGSDDDDLASVDITPLEDSGDIAARAEVAELLEKESQLLINEPSAGSNARVGSAAQAFPPRRGSKIETMMELEAKMNTNNESRHGPKKVPVIPKRQEMLQNENASIADTGHHDNQDDGSGDDLSDIKVAATPRMSANVLSLAAAGKPPKDHYDCMFPAGQPLGIQLSGGEAAGPFGASPIVVEGLQPRSEAADQGCKVGDTLIAVNGTLVVGKALAVVHDNLFHEGGRRNVLRFRSEITGSASGDEGADPKELVV